MYPHLFMIHLPKLRWCLSWGDIFEIPWTTFASVSLFPFDIFLLTTHSLIPSRVSIWISSCSVVSVEGFGNTKINNRAHGIPVEVQQRNVWNHRVGTVVKSGLQECWWEGDWERSSQRMWPGSQKLCSLC